MSFDLQTQNYSVAAENGYSFNLQLPDGTISDKEQPITADRDISFLNNIVSEMAYYHVLITQTPHQTIIVTCGKNNYIDSFYTSYNMPYTVALKHDKGYQPGILNTKSGYITSDIDIYASGAIKYTAAITNDIQCDISAGIHVGDWDINSDLALANTTINSDITCDLSLYEAAEPTDELTGDVTLLSDPINIDLSSDFSIAYTFFIRFINIADLTLVMRDFEQDLLAGDVDVPYQLIQLFATGDVFVQNFDINYLIQSATSPTFSRNSIAYDDSGNQVAAGVSRFGTNGWKCEEGTVNLAPNPNPTQLSDYYQQGGNLTWNNGVHFASNSSIPTYAYENYSFTNGNIYTLSFNIKMDDSSIPRVGSNNSSFDCTPVIGGIDIITNITLDSLGGGVYRVHATSSNTTYTLPNFGVVSYALQSHKPFTLIGNIQLEQKNYPTSFISGTRVAEQLTIPANYLNYQQGEIQFDWTPINQPFTDMTTQNKRPKIFQIGAYYVNNSITLWHCPSNTLDGIRLFIKGANNSGWSGIYGIVGNYNLNSKYRIAVVWKNANTFCLSINGIEGISNLTIPDSITALSSLVFGGTVNEPVNEYISNLRISNTFHTATQRTADYSLSTLPVLMDTTYYAPLTSDLSAVYSTPTIHEIPSDITLANDYINSDIASDINLTKWSFNNDLSCDVTVSTEPAYFYNGAKEYDGTITYDT